jgi:hypothetical protein
MILINQIHIQSSAPPMTNSTTFVSKNDTLVTFSGKNDLKRGKWSKTMQKDNLEISHKYKPPELISEG